MDGFADWIAQRGQIDFGNLAVGVGTMAVAFATYRNIARISRTELASARREWINDIRREMATFIQIYETIEWRIEDERPGDISFRAWSEESPGNQRRYDEMKKAQYRIVLMLNSEIRSHRLLMEQMDHLLQEGRKGVPERFIRIAQIVCRQEWELTKTELQQ